MIHSLTLEIFIEPLQVHHTVWKLRQIYIINGSLILRCNSTTWSDITQSVQCAVLYSNMHFSMVCTTATDMMH